MQDHAIRVLIVEDDPAFTDLYTHYLLGDTESLFDPTVVDTGAAGQAIWSKSPPDCMILDFQLPDTTGLDVLDEIRAHYGNVPFAVVMISAHASTELATAALSAGALDCLDKTRVTSPGLLRAVRTAIERSRLQRQVEDQRREVAEQARRSRQILERITDGFFALDRSWRFTFVNPVAEQVLGRDRGRLLGEPLTMVFPSLVDSPMYLQLSRALDSGDPTAFEMEYEPRQIWLEVHSYPDNEGVSVYFHDVTARKRAEAERERQLLRGETLLHVVRGFAAESDPQRLVELIADEAMRLLGGDHVLLARWDPHRQALTPVGTASPEENAASPARHSPSIDVAVEHRRPVIVNAKKANGERRPRARTKRVWPQVAAPLVDEERLVGAISVTSSDPNRRFTREDAELLDVLAGLASATIVGHEEARLGGVLLSARTAQHEVNNRLALVRGYAEIVADHPDLPDDLRQPMREILRGARAAAESLRQLGKLDALREVEWGPGLRPTLDLSQTSG